MCLPTYSIIGPQVKVISMEPWFPTEFCCFQMRSDWGNLFGSFECLWNACGLKLNKFGMHLARIWNTLAQIYT